MKNFYPKKNKLATWVQKWARYTNIKKCLFIKMKIEHYHSVMKLESICEAGSLICREIIVTSLAELWLITQAIVILSNSDLNWKWQDE